MDYLALSNALAQKASIPHSGLTDVTLAQDELEHVTTWVADAYEALQTLQSGKWKFLHQEYTRDTRAPELLDAAAAVDKSTTPATVGIPITGHSFIVGDEVTFEGTDNYDRTFPVLSQTANEIVITATFVAETFAITDTVRVRDYEFYTLDGIQSFDEESFHYFLKTDGVHNKQRLGYTEYIKFKSRFVDYTESALPSQITLTPTNRFRLDAFPDAIYTIEAEAFIKPQILAANSDTPLMPDNFHMLIVWKALIDYAGFEEAGAVFQHAALKYDELYNQLLWQQKYEVEDNVVQSDTWSDYNVYN